jgi:uncharacterized protein YjbI with pentapeptide repeats
MTTVPVAPLVYVGKYKFSIALTTSGSNTQTYYMAGLDPPELIGFTTDPFSAMVFALYEISGTSPQQYGLQGVSPVVLAQNGTAPSWLGFLGLSTPNNGGEYATGLLGTLDHPPPVQCDIGGGTTRFYVPAGGGYLLAQGIPPSFWVPPLGSFFDGGRWTMTAINSWGSDMTGADLKYVQFQQVVMLALTLKNADLSYANLSGAWFLGMEMKGAILEQINANGTYFSALAAAGQSGFVTDLTSADFTGAYLAAAQFQGCKMKDATLSGAFFTASTSFAGADLSGATFGSANLSSIDFSGATLNTTNLKGADLANANFNGADLTDADLSNTTLTGADFTNATLAGTNLSGSTFNAQTKFTGATMNGTNFEGCDLSTAQFSSPPKFYITPLVAPTTALPLTSMKNATLPLTLIGTDWTWLDLTGATIDGTLAKDLTGFKAQYTIFPAQYDLSASTLDDASFAHATMHNVHLENSTAANSSPPDFTGADLTSAQMAKVTLRHANFTTAILSGVSLGESKLDYADFSAAHLETTGELIADLSYCSFLDAVFTGAFLNTTSALPGTNLTGARIWGSAAKMDSATISGAVFANAYLAHLDFQHVAGNTLAGASFSGACLVNCSFLGTSLTDVILSGACLQGANFTDATLYGAHMDNAAVDFSAGRLSITGSRDLPPSITYTATVIDSSATNAATKCPNSDNGPCSGAQWNGPGAPMTTWAAPTSRT